MFIFTDLIKLEQDLGKVVPTTLAAVTAGAERSGQGLRDLWAANVAATGGSHLPWLPDAITAEPKLGLGSIGVEVGPETGKRQGALGKGDEYGSRNTPAHMNGHRAADVQSEIFARDMQASLSKGMDEL